MMKVIFALVVRSTAIGPIQCNIVCKNLCFSYLPQVVDNKQFQECLDNKKKKVTEGQQNVLQEFLLQLRKRSEPKNVSVVYPCITGIMRLNLFLYLANDTLSLHFRFLLVNLVNVVIKMVGCFGGKMFLKLSVSGDKIKLWSILSFFLSHCT
jgi:hypothetical protein